MDGTCVSVGVCVRPGRNSDPLRAGVEHQVLQACCSLLQCSVLRFSTFFRMIDVPNSPGGRRCVGRTRVQSNVDQSSAFF